MKALITHMYDDWSSYLLRKRVIAGMRLTCMHISYS